MYSKYSEIPLNIEEPKIKETFVKIWVLENKKISFINYFPPLYLGAAPCSMTPNHKWEIPVNMSQLSKTITMPKFVPLLDRKLGQNLHNHQTKLTLE